MYREGLYYTLGCPRLRWRGRRDALLCLVVNSIYPGPPKLGSHIDDLNSRILPRNI